MPKTPRSVIGWRETIGPVAPPIGGQSRQSLSEGATRPARREGGLTAYTLCDWSEWNKRAHPRLAGLSVNNSVSICYWLENHLYAPIVLTIFNVVTTLSRAACWNEGAGVGVTTHPLPVRRALPLMVPLRRLAVMLICPSVVEEGWDFRRKEYAATDTTRHDRSFSDSKYKSNSRFIGARAEEAGGSRCYSNRPPSCKPRG
ncbi:hypothetical protein chiPu_0020165 [Chiloscyllium punctatum]|uniref:Uncharacterized protein n=1 Tax=Chiloscyllium punctatum TaxID=137246 RepID=A0A401RU66_CHIPU|nr:hypothetical protein [Chiloscyllium punctatum]